MPAWKTQPFLCCLSEGKVSKVTVGLQDELCASDCALVGKAACRSSGFLCSFRAVALMRSRVNDKFDTGDSVARSHASSINLMHIIKRIGVILIWFAGMAFIFAAANKNDPYLISMRGPGNI